MKSLDFLPKLFFSSQTFQNLASDQTKVADLSSEIKVQKSVSMCKKISCKIPPYFFSCRNQNPLIYILDKFNSFLWGMVKEDNPIAFPVSMFMFGFVFSCF